MTREDDQFLNNSSVVSQFVFNFNEFDAATVFTVDGQTHFDDDLGFF